MKKLLITSTDMMMIQFLVPHVKYLSEHGFHVEIACSEVGSRMEDVREALGGVAKAIHTLRLERSPVNPRNLLGYRDLRKLLKKKEYDIIWTNEPVMGVVTRLAARDARKSGTHVVYMCHGFHFFKGAGIPSWLIYYPIERIMAHFCDSIVTINQEDYRRAKPWLPEGAVVHIDGIGVDFSRHPCFAEREQTRESLGLTADDILLLSVGELQNRKNHAVILQALAKLNDPNLKFFICGKGELEKDLRLLAQQLKLENQFVLLGYRMDIPQIMGAADIYVHPSKREGLGLASLEAMAAGLPLVTSNIQGIPDYVENGVTGFSCDPMDVDSYADHIRILAQDRALRAEISRTNLERVRKYAIDRIQHEVCAYFKSLI